MKQVPSVLLCKAAPQVAALVLVKLPAAGWQGATTPLQPRAQGQDDMRTCLSSEKKER